jgi:WD40 repeat protein
MSGKRWVATVSLALSVAQFLFGQTQSPELKTEKPERPTLVKNGRPAATEPKQPLLDCYGDPLPKGAIARMGTTRLRHHHGGGSWYGIAFSPDGKILATTGWESVRVWDLTTGKLLRQIPGPKRTQYYSAQFFLDNGRQLVGRAREDRAGGVRDFVVTWDTSTGQRLRELPADDINMMTWSPDRKLIALLSKEGTISVFEAATFKEVAHQLPADDINMMNWSPDCKLIALLSKDGTISVFETATFKEVAHLDDRPGIRLLEFTRDGKGLITVQPDQIYRWDLASRTVRKTNLERQIPNYPAFGLTPDQQTLVIVPNEAVLANMPHEHGPISLWDVTTGKERVKLKGEFARTDANIDFTPDGQVFATNGTSLYKRHDHSTIAFWDVRTGELRKHLRLPVRFVTGLSISPDGRTLLTLGQSDQVIGLWDIATGKPVFDWARHTNAVTSLAFTPDGSGLLSGGLDGNVRLWDVASGKQLRELSGHTARCDVVAVAADGKAIISGGGDGCIRVQTPDGKQLWCTCLDGPLKERENAHHVLAIGVCPDSKTFATWSHNWRKYHYDFWELATARLLTSRFNDPGTLSNNAVMSPDVDRVAEVVFPDWRGARGKRQPAGAVVRELRSGREIIRLRQDGSDIWPQGFTSDSRTFVTVSRLCVQTADGWDNKGAVQLWELASQGERLTIPYHSLDYCFERAGLAPNNETLVTARDDGTMEFWDACSGTPLPGKGVSGVQTYCLAFSHDSKLVASGHADGDILIWKVPAKGAHKAPENNGETLRLEKWWNELAERDARRAYTAVCGLAQSPARTIPFFRQKLPPIIEASSDKIRPLIADLDAPQFPQREAARKELVAMGERAGPALRAALQTATSAEQRRRIEELLEGFSNISSETIRHVRAAEVLERIGNADAQELLQKLATGIPEARLTREAQSSLRRLTRGK